MRWVTLLVAALALTGCSGSHDDSSATDTSANETTAVDAPPGYTTLMAQLPPFDEPASPEVTAYRLATIGARSQRCARRSRGAAKSAFAPANRRVLALAGTVRGAQLLSEHLVPQRDDNGCRVGAGPATYYTTVRTYRVPRATTVADVFAYYERVLHYGWLETSGPKKCDRRFSQSAAYLSVDACGERLTLTALGREPVLLPGVERLPPRPFGLQYPAAADQPAPTGPSYEIASGETCERGSSVDVPSIIVPPPPGIRSQLLRGHAVVEWSFVRVLGDCPPRRILLWFESADGGTSFSTRVAVHEHTGTANVALPETLRMPSALRAATESVDGTRSRTVSVFIRRQT